MQAPVVLIILDGFGLAPASKGNAITKKTAPQLFSLMHKYPSTRLVAHGKAVGLFPDQEGNSEAGHFAIGSGRLVLQDLVRISEAISDGTFYKNEAFDQALFHAQKYKSAVHVMGLLTDGQSAHAHPEHLYALLEYFRRHKQHQVFLHLFTDGRDSSQNSAIEFLKALQPHLSRGQQIASIMGRFYAMDRNKSWFRTRLAYETMVLGRGLCTARSAEVAVTQAYHQGQTDEFICPTTIMKSGRPIATIKNNDVVYFFNARSDRARQITKAFVQPNFGAQNTGAFVRKRFPKNIRFVAMTDFGPDLPGIFTAFPSADIPNCLAKAIGEHRKQLYISETEKYAHVTYFINGGYPAAINGEKRELIPSSGHASYADAPEMQAKKMTDRILAHLSKGRYSFIAVNYSNADMVGHTGDLAAAKKAVFSLDTEVFRLVTAVLQQKGIALITADHGNAEVMRHPKTGEVDTQHSTNPVPLILVSAAHKKARLRQKGTLKDVAPTLLSLMGIQQPKEMTGKSLYVPTKTTRSRHS